MKKGIYLLLAVFFVVGGVGTQRILSRVRQNRANTPPAKQEQICDADGCEETQDLLTLVNSPIFKKPAMPKMPKVPVPSPKKRPRGAMTAMLNSQFIMHKDGLAALSHNKL